MAFTGNPISKYRWHNLMKQLAWLFLLMVYAWPLIAQPVFKSVKENLGPQVNDGNDQVVPMFSPERKTLYFSQNTGVNETYEVWQTQMDGYGQWSPKQKTSFISGPAQLNKYIFGAYPSGQFLINGKFSNKKDANSFEKGFSWYKRSSNQFNIEATQTLQIEGLDDMLQGQVANAFYHAGKKLLLLSFAFQGKRDIFICTPKAGQQAPFVQWNRPVPLPSSINTASEESCPFLDESGTVLYFSSNRPGGFGGDDIYCSKVLSSDYTQWSPAQNLGFFVNSNKSELYYSVSSADSSAYFVSYKNSYGAGDIFRIRFTMDQKWPLSPAPPVSQPIAAAAPPRSNNTTPTNRPVNAAATPQAPGNIAPMGTLANTPVITAIQLPLAEYKPNNVLLLLDISMSMASNNKMNFLRKASDQLLTRLRYIDKVSLLTFGEQANLLYHTASLRDKDSVLRLMQKLEAVEGETFVNIGLQKAYRQAIDTYIEAGNNEILVVTDGYFSINQSTVELIQRNPQIRLSFVLIDPGSIAPNIVNYVKNMLPSSLVVEMVNENLDVYKLLDTIKQHSKK
jgi:von Willebrand factor type A domain/WD40-like Beta Propeller Repeat